jgi:hypothetical protein
MPTCFHSTNHPGDRPTAHVVSKALVRPLAALAVPLMAGTTAAVLTGQSVTLALVVGMPLVMASATVYAHFRLGQTPAELCLRPGEAAVRSVRDVLYRTPRRWQPLYDARIDATETTLTIGWRTVRCQQAAWPAHDALQDAVRRARRPLTPPSRISS